MIQKVLFPGWNDLSTKDKTLIKKWIESLIKHNAEIVDSSTTSEGIKIEQIISSSNLDSSLEKDLCHAVCAAICASQPNPPPNCLKECKERLCNS